MVNIAPSLALQEDIQRLIQQARHCIERLPNGCNSHYGSAIRCLDEATQFVLTGIYYDKSEEG